MANQTAVLTDIDDSMMFEDEEDDEIQVEKYLLFRLGNETYGIEISRVLEIIAVQKITVLPDVPSYMKGVINLRGRIIPVIDMRLRFTMEERAHNDRTCIIIVTVGKRATGLLVDTVSNVQEISADHIESSPEFRKSSLEESYIDGIAKSEGEVRIILNVDKIVRLEDARAIDRTIGRAAGAGDNNTKEE